MKLQQKIGFHNKFELKVIRDSEVIQEGFAENIILDRMYTKLCALTPYYGQIVYGEGTGTLLSSRDTLFTRIGSIESVIVDRKQESLNTISITRKGVLGLGVANGKTITEVGISETTTNINTHAMITDSEGNTISITKTDLDIIEIYSTVYLEFSETNAFVISPNLLGKNAITNYVAAYLLQNTTTPLSDLRITVLEGDKQTSELLMENRVGEFIFYSSLNKNLSFTTDIPNKKTKATFRISVEELNSNHMGITDIVFQNEGFDKSYSMKLNFVDDLFYAGHQFSDKQIGVGNGIKTVFNMHRDATTVSVKVDDISVSGVTYQNYTKRKPLLSLCDISGLTLQEQIDLIGTAHTDTLYTKSGLLIPFQSVLVYQSPIIPIKAGVMDLNGWNFVVAKNNQTGTFNMKSKLEASKNGVDFFDLTSEKTASQIISSPILEYTGDLTHFRFSITTTTTSTNSSDAISHVLFDNPLVSETEACLKFDTPPSDGAIITASYKVPYIPKDANHVIDVNLELVWGEGVA